MTSEDGWTTVYEGPTIRMTKTIPEGDGLVGLDSIRAGIDAEILEKMEREALAAEDAAIVDDLMRQVKAGCIMPQIYVPLQVSHTFKKEEGDK